MTMLPQGWALATVPLIADNLDSHRVPVNKTERAARPGVVPYYGATGQVGWIDRPLFNEELCLLGEDGAPFLERDKPKAYLIDGPSWVNNHAHVLRALNGATSNRFLKYVLDWTDYGTHVNGTTRLKLTKGALANIPVPLPPLNEQRRIVAAIEQQFSRLDAADQALRAALRRISLLRRSILVSVIPRPLPSHWKTLRIDDAGKVQLGRQRSPKYHHGPNMKPYLRVANVFEDRLDLSDVMEMQFSAGELERYVLHRGDILLNEGQSPELVGRAAMFRGELQEVCFTNSLIRFQPGPDVDGEFALLVFRSHLHSGRFQQEARITTNIAHMAAGRFKTVEFPLPPAGEQSMIVTETQRRLSLVDALERDVRVAVQRASALRRSILERAFRGELVPQDPSDEPASALLERIATERAASETTNGRRPRRRATMQGS